MAYCSRPEGWDDEWSRADCAIESIYEGETGVPLLVWLKAHEHCELEGRAMTSEGYEKSMFPGPRQAYEWYEVHEGGECECVSGGGDDQ